MPAWRKKRTFMTCTIFAGFSYPNKRRPARLAYQFNRSKDPSWTAAFLPQWYTNQGQGL